MLADATAAEGLRYRWNPSMRVAIPSIDLLPPLRYGKETLLLELAGGEPGPRRAVGG